MLWAVRSAILVDFDNVGSAGMRASIANWMAWLEDGAFARGERKRKFLTKRVYWNGRSDEHRADFERAGFEAFACRPLSLLKADKQVSAADLRLAAHAVDLAHRLKPKGLREVFIFSTDTDFVPIVDMLQEELKLRVIALARDSDASSAVYRDHAEQVISTRDLTAAFAYERKGPSLARGVPTAPAPEPKPRAAPQSDRIEAAADKVVTMAMRSPGLAIGRERVIRTLKSLPGFSVVGSDAWLGWRNYGAMMNEIVSRRPNQLERRVDPTNRSVHYYPKN